MINSSKTMIIAGVCLHHGMDDRNCFLRVHFSNNKVNVLECIGVVKPCS